MALTTLENDTDQLPEVPYLSDWTSKGKNDGTAYTVNCLKVTTKGILLFTELFKVFIWKSESIHNKVLEHVGSHLEGMKAGEFVAVLLVKATKKGFSIGLDDAELGTWKSDGEVYSYEPSFDPPSVTPLELPLDGDVVDSSPKNGRRAR